MGIRGPTPGPRGEQKPLAAQPAYAPTDLVGQGRDRMNLGIVTASMTAATRRRPLDARQCPRWAAETTERVLALFAVKPLMTEPSFQHMT